MEGAWTVGRLILFQGGCRIPTPSQRAEWLLLGGSSAAPGYQPQNTQLLQDELCNGALTPPHSEFSCPWRMPDGSVLHPLCTHST